MNEDLQKLVGETIKSIEVFKAYDGLESSFLITFESGLTLNVSSRGFYDSSSVVEVDVS